MQLCYFFAKKGIIYGPAVLPFDTLNLMKFVCANLI
ncbi:hypothetical protein SAMN06269173_102408 [Hymenobacter mucosus]|uniref:Uncharacterized protein n=1 Tax=Hymenobacter mucosus TaxID=1411120 RepID=A0A238WB36_9BACT|nr:hypothetical protein SAMN06269173_102408 [Hymenobacter mucosus]